MQNGCDSHLRRHELHRFATPMSHRAGTVPRGHSDVRPEHLFPEPFTETVLDDTVARLLEPAP